MHFNTSQKIEVSTLLTYVDCGTVAMMTEASLTSPLTTLYNRGGGGGEVQLLYLPTECLDVLYIMTWEAVAFTIPSSCCEMSICGRERRETKVRPTVD